MITRLSEVLRYSLDGAQEQEIRLEKELDILRRYLEILEIRYRALLYRKSTSPVARKESLPCRTSPF